jgi:Protein of unknown function (DUF3142)
MPTPLGRRSFSITGSAALLCALAGQANAQAVKAEDHTAFWLWAGVRPQPALASAKEIYILAGEVRDDDIPHVISQRGATPRVENALVWIVYRAQTIAWDDNIFKLILAKTREWQADGNNVIGLQIDFDAGTKNLDRYAAFLHNVRQRLPAKLKLGITGLLDWSANGDPAGLAALSDVVDEVVLQIYQGRRVIPGYQDYSLPHRTSAGRRLATTAGLGTEFVF